MGGTPASGSHTCLAAIDTPAGPWLCELPLSPGMRVADALAAAQVQAQALEGSVASAAGLAHVDWQSDRVGVWGQPCARAVAGRRGSRGTLPAAAGRSARTAARPRRADPRAAQAPGAVTGLLLTGSAWLPSTSLATWSTRSSLNHTVTCERRSTLS